MKKVNIFSKKFFVFAACMLTFALSMSSMYIYAANIESTYDERGGYYLDANQNNPDYTQDYTNDNTTAINDPDNKRPANDPVNNYPVNEPDSNYPGNEPKSNYTTNEPEDAYIYIYYRSVAGHDVYASSTIKGIDGETLDLSDYVRDITTMTHVGYEPASGQLTFDKKRRGSGVILYEKNQKLNANEKQSEDTNTQNNENKPSSASNPNQHATPSADYSNQNENFSHEDNSNTGNPNRDNLPVTYTEYDGRSYIAESNEQTNAGSSNIGNSRKLRHDRNIKIMSGYKDGTIRPNNTITREEVATVIYRLLSSEYKTGISGEYPPDINPDRWSADAVRFTASMQMFPDATATSSFRPEENATRGDVAYAVAHLISDDYDSYTSNAMSFPDIVATRYEQAVNIVTSKSLMKGYPDGTFKPYKTITRAEFIVVMNKLLGKEKTGSDIYFKDISKSAWYYKDIQMAVSGND